MGGVRWHMKHMPSGHKVFIPSQSYFGSAVNYESKSVVGSFVLTQPLPLGKGKKGDSGRVFADNFFAND